MINIFCKPHLEGKPGVLIVNVFSGHTLTFNDMSGVTSVFNILNCNSERIPRSQLVGAQWTCALCLVVEIPFTGLQGASMPEEKR
jgi:hypothetical protein